MFFYVQVWQRLNANVAPIQQRVQAPSEAHAIVQVMRQHHLSYADRAWVSPSVLVAPTVRLNEVVVKGKVRSWKQEPEAGSAWDRLQQVVLELGYSLHRDLQGITLEHEQQDTLRVLWRDLDCLALITSLYSAQKRRAR